MILVSGLIAGLIHTISGPDHLAAIAPLTTKNTNQRYRIGFYWSLGHTLGLLIFFICALSLKDIFDLHTLSSIPEYIIAVILIYMGIRGLNSMFEYTKYTDHNKRINGSLKYSFGIGTLHGTAGGNHLFAFIYVLTLSSNLEKGLYILLYVIGASISMIFFIQFLNIISHSIVHHFGFNGYSLLLGALSLLSITIGLCWLII